MKSLNDQEREVINAKLIESCEQCWSRYGYKKTGIRELCELAGIPSGSFYMFYPSKEHLFFQTAQAMSDRITGVLYENIPDNPTKYDFAEAMKRFFAELEKNEWFLLMETEMEGILRKLPQEFINESLVKGVAEMAEVIEKFKLKLRVSTDVFTCFFTMLSPILMNKKNIGEPYHETFAYMLNTMIENMVE